MIICNNISQCSYCMFLLSCSLKKQLEGFIETCKFPPKPDAVCRKHCSGEGFIYFTDPDFKVSNNALWLLFGVAYMLQSNRKQVFHWAKLNTDDCDKPRFSSALLLL